MELASFKGAKRLRPGELEDNNYLPEAKRKYFQKQEPMHAGARLQVTTDVSPPFNSLYSDHSIASSPGCLSPGTSPYPFTRDDSYPTSSESPCLRAISSLGSGLVDIHLFYGTEGDTRMLDGPTQQSSTQSRPTETTLTGQGYDIKAQKTHAETRETTELCFGMICGGRVALFDKASASDLVVTKCSTPQEAILQFSLLHYQDNFILESSTQIQLGVLDIQMAKTLNSIVGLDTIRFEAFMSSRHGIKSTLRPRESKENLGDPTTIDINIYGSRAILNEVGKKLSDIKVYLQQPDHLDESIVYDNPHYFASSGWPAPAIGVSPPAIIHSDLSNEIKTVFDSLDQDSCLETPEFSLDTQIKTKLLRHQKEGLYFIARREGDFETGKLSLWQLDKCNDQHFYHHTITGSRTAHLPDECRGGILADDMGLGKTLTTLSNICRSLENANAFARGHPNQPDLPNCRPREISGKIVAKTTLIVVPLSLLDGWIEEIKKHIIPGSLTYHKYHGKKRETDPLKLRSFDVILTTYATVASSHLTNPNPLGNLYFYRLVLDEAHIIRHHLTTQFRAVSSLSAVCRWCVTGTPVQNKLEDIESLIKFLRLTPFDDNKSFDKFITDPLKVGNVDGLRNLRTLLGSICLRRTQAILTKLPESIEKVRLLEFTLEEQDKYKEVIEKSKEAIDDIVCGISPTNTYHQILQAILRLRLLCNHGTFDVRSSHASIPSKGESSPSPDCTLDLLQEAGEATCVYCHCFIDSLNNVESPTSGSLTTCCHFLCPDCLPRYQSSLVKVPGKKGGFGCPLCHNHLGLNYLVTAKAKKTTKLSTSSRSIPDFSLQNGISTKVSALLSDIEGSADEKSIVFSYWTKSLDLVESALYSRGIRYLRLDGSLAAGARKTVITKFREDSTVKVLLMTTGTGAVGLNLTVASRVHLLEPQWNPMVDTQAIGRIRRLGQKRPVSIFRYIMRNTIEEAVQSRQMKKLQLAELTHDTECKDQGGSVVDRIRNLRALL